MSSVSSWEHSPGRLTHRDGHRRRVLSTKAGDLELGIPKSRKGSFFPEVPQPRRRIDQPCTQVVTEADPGQRTLLSHAGRAHIGVATDPTAITEPDRLVHDLEAAIAVVTKGS